MKLCQIGEFWHGCWGHKTYKHRSKQSLYRCSKRPPRHSPENQYTYQSSKTLTETPRHLPKHCLLSEDLIKPSSQSMHLWSALAQESQWSMTVHGVLTTVNSNDKIVCYGWFQKIACCQNHTSNTTPIGPTILNNMRPMDWQWTKGV